MFTTLGFGLGPRRCKALTGYANVPGQSNSTSWFLWGVLMKKLAAIIFFAMVGSNAMAQAGGASTGSGTAGAGAGAAGTTVGVVAAVAAVVVGVAAASSNNSTSTPNHH